MGKADKHYITFKKIRFAIFTRSYAHYYIARYIKETYEIDEKLSPKELRKRYLNKYAIPEISRLARTLHFDYALIWKSILCNKIPTLSNRIEDKEIVKKFISIESEIISLFIAKQNKSYFRDSDYESESALLSLAVERAVGNDMEDIEDDRVFDQQVEELRRQYTYLYYKISGKYKLPTIRIVPFIVRLII